MTRRDRIAGLLLAVAIGAATAACLFYGEEVEQLVCERCV